MNDDNLLRPVAADHPLYTEGTSFVTTLPASQTSQSGLPLSDPDTEVCEGSEVVVEGREPQTKPDAIGD